MDEARRLNGRFLLGLIFLVNNIAVREVPPHEVVGVWH